MALLNCFDAGNAPKLNVGFTGSANLLALALSVAFGFDAPQQAHLL